LAVADDSIFDLREAAHSRSNCDESLRDKPNYRRKYVGPFLTVLAVIVTSKNGSESGESADLFWRVWFLSG
jgi:hypothetical protein